MVYEEKWRYVGLKKNIFESRIKSHMDDDAFDHLVGQDMSCINKGKLWKQSDSHAKRLMH